MHKCYIIFIKKERSDNMATNKKRLTITLAEKVYSELEKMAREKGLSKSAMLTVALEEYKKGQKNA